MTLLVCSKESVSARSELVGQSHRKNACNRLLGLCGPAPTHPVYSRLYIHLVCSLGENPNPYAARTKTLLIQKSTIYFHINSPLEYFPPDVFPPGFSLLKHAHLVSFSKEKQARAPIVSPLLLPNRGCCRGGPHAPPRYSTRPEHGPSQKPNRKAER